MILVDLYCPACSANFIDVMIDNNDDLPKCDVCDVELKKWPSAVSFKLVYNNRTDMCDWDGNSSQYWNEIKRTGGDEPENDKQPKWE